MGRWTGALTDHRRSDDGTRADARAGSRSLPTRCTQSTTKGSSGAPAPHSFRRHRPPPSPPQRCAGYGRPPVSPRATRMPRSEPRSSSLTPVPLGTWALFQSPTLATCHRLVSELRGAERGIRVARGLTGGIVYRLEPCGAGTLGKLPAKLPVVRVAQPRCLTSKGRGSRSLVKGMRVAA